MKNCPLCNNDNLCGVKNIADCWCTKIEIPPALLKKVPASQRNKSCICVQCIKKFNFKLAKDATKR